MLARYDDQFYNSPHFGEVSQTAFQSYADDLPSALVAAFPWFVLIGIFSVPPVASSSAQVLVMAFLGS